MVKSNLSDGILDVKSTVPKEMAAQVVERTRIAFAAGYSACF
jgi:organic hydroperoxide reductase OsmC/OhrA